MKDLLLEIGTEEIPARFMEPVLRQMEELGRQMLKENRFTYEELHSYGTPRRLALYIKSLPEKQADTAEEIKGPPVRVAFNENGPTKAATGFARSQGVPVDELIVRETTSGAYVFAIKKTAGQVTGRILPEILKEFILSLYFPKPMRWAYKKIRFIRPIHWLVALHGNEIVPLEIEGIKAGRISRGHRFLAKDPVILDEPAEYFKKLEKVYVIADQKQRKKMIEEQLEVTARENGGKVPSDEELVEEVTYLLEYPTAVCGKFPEKYLRLPREALITPMREHQRYFPVLSPDGKLLPKFITFRNGLANDLDLVREGNEKVLQARLADAEFFYEEDLKMLLDENVLKLKNIVFQEKLGSLYNKTQRVVRLTDYLADILDITLQDKDYAKRAAFLAKADLVTNMVNEFPELQGIMGAHYACQAGEPEEVTRGIFEHYLPRYAGDKLAQTLPGLLVCLADKIDTLVGCFAVGFQPTGSEDPYALRRQALGVCHTVLHHQLDFPLSEPLKKAYAFYRKAIETELSEKEVEKSLGDFFKQRLRYILIEKGFRYDTVEAVLAVSYDRLWNACRRAEALERMRQQPEFGALVTAYTRAANLAQKGKGGKIVPEYFEFPVEKEIYDRWLQVKKEVERAYGAGEYFQGLKAVVSLRETIDRYFDQVMVMVEDERIRDNRLAMLKEISGLVDPILDLSRVVKTDQ